MVLAGPERYEISDRLECNRSAQRHYVASFLSEIFTKISVDCRDGGGAGDETNGENYGAMVTAGINDVGNHNLLGICQFGIATLCFIEHVYKKGRFQSDLIVPIFDTEVAQE